MATLSSAVMLAGFLGGSRILNNKKAVYIVLYSFSRNTLLIRSNTTVLITSVILIYKGRDAILKINKWY